MSNENGKFGLEQLSKLIDVIKNMSKEEYESLLERSNDVRGPNGDLSYNEQVERGYFYGAYLDVEHGLIINGIYRYYKNDKLYNLMCVAVNEMGQEVVVYYALHNGPGVKYAVMPLDTFREIVHSTVHRFESIISLEDFKKLEGE